jgi:hypothetical protein
MGSKQQKTGSEVLRKSLAKAGVRIADNRRTGRRY